MVALNLNLYNYIVAVNNQSLTVKSLKNLKSIFVQSAKSEYNQAPILK